MKTVSTKSTVILQHGLKGPVPWFKWIQNKCKEAGLPVRVPLMPNADVPDCQAWLTQMQKNYGDITDAIIVAHSLGGLALVHYLGERETKVDSELVVSGEGVSAVAAHAQIARAVIFIAPPAHYTGKPNTEQFYNEEPDWETARTRARHFVLIHSAEDPSVAPEHVLVYQERLGAELISVAGEGHFLGNENELVWKQIQRFSLVSLPDAYE